MEQIQNYRKAFFMYYYIVTFSYLLLPLGFFLSKGKKKDIIPLTFALYGIAFFWLLLFYDDIPKEIKRFYQTFYTFLEYAVFAFIFLNNIKTKKLRSLIILASIAFFIFQLIYVITTRIKHLDSIPIGIESILIFVYIFLFFYEFSKSISNFYIYNHYCFWVAAGILIYLGGSFFFYILFSHLSREQITTFGNLTYLAEIIKNVLFTLAIFMYVRYPLENTKNKTSSIPYLDMI